MMEKFYEEVCLLERPSLKTRPPASRSDRRQGWASLGENIVVRRFARFKVGDATATVAFVSAKPERRRRSSACQVATEYFRALRRPF